MSKNLTKHDKFFRSMTEHVDVVREFLVNNLPSTILSKIDLSSIRLEKEVFISDRLKQSAVDLLCSVNFKDTARKGYCYILY